MKETKPSLHILQIKKNLHIPSLIESKAVFEHFNVTKSHVINKKYDLVYTQTYAARRIYDQLIQYSGKYIIHMGGDIWNEFNFEKINSRYVMITEIIKRASVVVSNSQQLERVIKQTVPLAVVMSLPGGLWGTSCTPKGINPYRFDTKALYAARTPLRVIMNIAIRIERKYKGLIHFLELTDDIRKKYGIEIHCAGKVDNIIAPMLEKKHGVKFIGQRDDWNKILHTYDLFVHPSMFDCFPRAVGEAMSCGLPCMVYDVAGSSEVGDATMLVDPNDGNMVRYVFECFLSDEKMRRSLGKQARIEALEKTKKHEHDYLNILKYVANKGK